jgi:hypothetical protein
MTHSEECRRKMSESQQRRLAENPKQWRRWTEEADDLVRTLAPSEAATRTGRTVKSIWEWRKALRVNPAG